MSSGSRQQHQSPRYTVPLDATPYNEGLERWRKRMGLGFSVEDADRCVTCTPGHILDFPEDARVDCEAQDKPCPFHGSAQSWVQP